MELKRERGGEEGRDGGDGRRSNEPGRVDQREEYSWMAGISGGGGGAQRQSGGDGSRDSSGREWERRGCGSRERSSGVSSKVETGSFDVKVSVNHDKEHIYSLREALNKVVNLRT